MSRNQVAVEREVHDLVATLRDSGARLASLIGDGALDLVPEAALPALALDLRAASEPVAAATTCVVSRIHSSGTTLPDGHVSVSRWLQAQSKASSGTAKQLIGRGRSLDGDYTRTRLAWLTGAVTGDHVRVLTLGVDKAVRSLPAGAKEGCRAQAEEFLLRVAEHLTPDELAKAAAHLKFIVDPDGTNQQELDNADAQQVTFTRVGDGVQVTGFLTHEAAAVIQTALDQVVDGWYRRGELPAEDADPDGSDPEDPKVQRSRRLRRPRLDALALADICGRLLESGDLGGKHGAIPRITLTADLATLATRGGDLESPHHETAAAVPPASMLAHLCDAAVTTIITTPGGNGCDADRAGDGLLAPSARTILWVGREERVITRAQRAVLAVVYPHCAFPGCRVPASRCIGHHVIHWTDGGPTDPENLVMICPAHHRSVHHGGWDVVPTGTDPLAPGYWTFVPPPRPGPEEGHHHVARTSREPQARGLSERA